MTNIKKAAKKAQPKKEENPDSVEVDTHERCRFLDGVLKIFDFAGKVIEDIPQAWRHGKSVETAK